MIIRIFTVKSDPADDLDKKALPETEMMRKMRAQLGKLSLANKGDQTSGRGDEVFIIFDIVGCYCHLHAY